MLEIRHLYKTYDGAATPAVADFSLTVDTGEFVSLIGPTGCGKTTVLRTVMGLLAPSGGDLLLDGRLSLKPSPEKAMVFQMFNLFPWRTALGNVAYGLEVQGVPKKERFDKAREYLRLVGLSDRTTHYPHQLSGGQNQRVGLARALAIQPKLLLMDEPFGALDALTREYLQGMVARICADTSLSVLLVTHSVDEAIFLSDRIIVMGAGGTLIRELEVDLPRPRGEGDWRETPEYARLRSEVWNLLKGELRFDENLAGAA
ncbi:MAG TPA: ABC transporter ATP-binding protein [Solirubrobacteraceae bacterium]|jgi:NitT/TauT family transport system ATP-binding protein|nr:ABC transporter ATP-binding protein [Solirubrobacteraceae bacterium]